MLQSFKAFALTALSLLATITIAVGAKPNIEMVFDVCECNSTDPDGYIASLNCFVSKNVKRRTFSIGLQFKKPINKFNVNLCIELPRKPQNFVLFNFTNLDGCQMLANRNQVTLLQVGISTLSRYSNLPKHCPLKKMVSYYIRGFRMDMNLFPAFTFETTLNAHFEWLVNEKKLLSGFIQGHTVVKKSKSAFVI